MEQDIIKQYAKELVNITIKKYKEKSLGKEKMSKFIKDNLTSQIQNDEYDAILHLYSKYLAKEGYEIKRDINNFDIVEYSSDKYQIYLNNLLK